MKTKELSLNIRIPAKFKYLARQPWGDITLFEEEPKIVGDYEEVSCWGTQNGGRLSLFGSVAEADLLDVNTPEDWKNSLIHLP
jgi:hypothetical protein